MLTASEKKKLYEIISAILGEDESIRLASGRFNEQTVRVVEDMAATHKDCNANMKQLLRELVGGAAILTKGWLRRLLKVSGEALGKAELNGYACLVGVKSRWKTLIISSTY